MLVPPLVPAMSEAAAMFEALRVLTEQVKVMAEKNQQGGKKWDNLDKYKNLKQFDGKQQDFEEWNVKFRSLVCAGDRKVGQLMSAIEKECTEDELAKGKFTRDGATELGDGVARVEATHFLAEPSDLGVRH